MLNVIMHTKLIMCRNVSIWNLQTGSHLFNLDGRSGIIHSTNMSDGGNLAITGSADFSIRIWDLKSPPVSQTTRYHETDTLAVAVSPCGNYAISGGQDLSIKVYDLHSMTVLKQLQGHQGAVNHIVALRDSRHLVSGSTDGSICLWNGETEELVRTFQDDKIDGGVNCIAVSADSELLMSGSEDGQVAFWSVKTGKLLKTFNNHKSPIVSVAFAESATTKYLLSASRDGLVCVRDFYTAKILLSKQTHTADLLCLAVSRDATMFATGSKDKECYVIGLPNGSLKAVLTGHKGPVRSVTIIQGGKMCITASEDCTLRLWNIAQSECISTLHADLPILCLDTDRHEKTILYGTRDGWVSTALYYDLSLGDSSNDQNPILKGLKGISSPSSSSFAETDSTLSQSSMVRSSETELQSATVNNNTVDASLIPLPPSDEDSSSVEDKSTASKSSCSEAKQNDDSPDGGVLLTPPTSCMSDTPHDSSPLQTSVETNGLTTTTTQYEKPTLDHDGFVDPEIATILKIKSEIITDTSDHESVHSVHEGVDSNSDKSKTTPQTSSLCTVL